MDTWLLRFNFPPQTKKQAVYGHNEWGGVVQDWPADEPPFLLFGDRAGTRKQGRVVTMQAEPGQLLYYCGCTTTGRPLKLFGLAWRCPDGSLVAQALPRELVARAVFEAGGHQEPADDTAQALESIARVDLDETDPLRGFQELCSITASYMETHLLVGAPVFEPDANPDEFAVKTVETLVNHSLTWPSFREVLLAAVDRFSEWHRGP